MRACVGACLLRRAKEGCLEIISTNLIMSQVKKKVNYIVYRKIYSELKCTCIFVVLNFFFFFSRWGGGVE